MSDRALLFWLAVGLVASLGLAAIVGERSAHDEWLRECEISGGAEGPDAPYQCIDGG